jgi:hypothetical protein
MVRGCSWRRTIAAAGSAVAAVGLLVAGGSPVAGATAWQVVASPNVAGSNYNELDATLATSATQAWAVGFSRVGFPAPFRAMAQRWNGTTWSLVPTAPVPAADDTRLHGLSGTGPADLWAVGADINASGSQVSLIEHWNGSAWSRIPSPAGEPAASELVSVSALSPTDAWAVGDARPGFSFTTLIEHWDGTAWHVVADAGFLATGFNHLSSVAAISANNVWAVGRTGRHPNPIIEHWNGTSWTQVAQPAHGYNSTLQSLAVVSASDIWAVGGTDVTNTLVEHWNGTVWSVVASPNSGAQNAQSFLSGAVALGPRDVWAVGSASTFSSPQTLTEHWDGTAWTIAPSPSPGSSSLAAVGGRPAGPLFAVGAKPGSTYTTLILQH